MLVQISTCDCFFKLIELLLYCSNIANLTSPCLHVGSVAKAEIEMASQYLVSTYDYVKLIFVGEVNTIKLNTIKNSVGE